MRIKKYPPPGELVEIGNHRQHIHVSGNGSPTVVLVSGGSSWSMDWYLVQREVEKITRVCSFDRAGYGWSDPGPKPRTSGKFAEELNLLLERAEISSPYILVGASFGAHTVRLFCNKYPEKVAGVILLDARHEKFSQKMPPAWKEIEKSGLQMMKTMAFVSRLGIINILKRFFGQNNVPPIVELLPDDLKQTYLEVGFQTKYFQTGIDETNSIEESDWLVSQSNKLGDIPLTIIRHGVPDMFSQMPGEQANQAEEVWQELQRDLLKLSTNNRIIVAEKSGHNIAVDQPALVINEIARMIKMSSTDFVN